MILGKIFNKITTNKFQFLVEKETKKFEFVQVLHKVYDYVLCQVVEIERTDKDIAKCIVIGYKDDKDRIKPIRIPFDQNSEVLKAEDEFIKSVIELEDTEKGAFIGKLEGKNIDVHLDLKKLLTKHVAILAKSGAGKCLNHNTDIFLGGGQIKKIDELVDSEIEKGYEIEDGVQCRKNDDCSLTVFSKDNLNQIKPCVIKTFMRRESPKFIYEIKTRSGKTLKLTKEHPIPILNEKIKWIQASQLEKNDYMLLPRIMFKGKEQEINFINILNSNKIRIDNEKVLTNIKSHILKKYRTIKIFSNKINYSYSAVKEWFTNHGLPLSQFKNICDILNLKIDSFSSEIKFLRWKTKIIPAKISVDKDFAKLFGYMLAEGNNSQDVIRFENIDKNIRKDYSRLVKKIFNLKTSITKRVSSLHIYNKFLSHALSKIGFTSSSWTKFVPEEILSSKKEVLEGFLESFIDCDGYISKNKPEIEICLASKKLIKNIEMMFLRLGIVSLTKKKIIKGK